MPEFLHLKPPQEALQVLLEYVAPLGRSERVEAATALGRVLASPVTAPHALPEFPRTTVDGYAVRAADTFGAGESLPAYLSLAGEVPMGAPAEKALQPGECMLIHTGGMLPPGADAVVMLEYTQQSRADEIEVLRAVAVGENVIQVGEDIQAGGEVFPSGKRLRPADIGGLMALGILTVEVAVRPLVGIISSGDEVIPPEQRPAPGQVRDINAYTLSAAVAQAGGRSRFYGIVPDRREAMLAAARQARQECDMVVITAGSSASTRDLTADVLNSLGEPGVLVHGVNTRPGKPTILAVCDGVPMIGLPGNPVSALVNTRLFVTPALGALMGERPRPQPVVRAVLEINLASQAGREDWVPVRLHATDQGYRAEPIFGKSNLIFTLAHADGLLKIPPAATGLAAGEVVDVVLL